jgi:TP901 family phage tail tape measure protein
MASGDFLAKIKLALEGKEGVISGLQQTQQAAQQLSRTKVTTIFDKEGLVTGKKIEETFKQIQPAAAGAAGGMNDFQKALSRVIVVAPIWMAFRATIQLVTSTINDGFRTWMEFDQQLIKSKAVIHDFSGSTETAMGQLEDTIRKFSTESGISLKELASSFYRFGTVGIAFADSLSGAIASAKLAKATLGDTDTIARSLAMTYRLLGDTIDSSLSPMEKQESLAGKIYHLWKTNAFEATEYAGSLNNFISTANIANFTTDQTIALLASLGTAGVQGARGGTLLKTAIQKLVDNLDLLAPKLGLAVNPELENTFSLFMRVLTAINELSKTKGIPKAALDSIKDIFGGVRGGQVVSALNALLPELKKNLEDLGKDPQKFIQELDGGFKQVTNTASGQLEIFKRLKEQMGETFVKGIVGGEDFKTSLETLNNFMINNLIPAAEQFGQTFKDVAMFIGTAGIGNVLSLIYSNTKAVANEQSKVYEQVLATYKGQLSYGQVMGLISNIEKNYTEKTLAGREKILIVLKDEGLKIAENKGLKELEVQTTAKLSKEENDRLAKTKELSIILQDRLSLVKTELKILGLQKAGVSDTIIAHKKLDGIISTIVERYNDLIDASGQQVESISEQSVKAMILTGNFEGLLKLFKEMNLTEKEINSLADEYININKAILSDTTKLISHELELAKIRGASGKILFDIETQLNGQLYGINLITSSLDYQLSLEKQVVQEKINQFKISKENATLAKIAKEEGAEMARGAAEILAGMREMPAVGTRLGEIMQQFFPTETEAAGLNAYLKDLGLSMEQMAGSQVRPLTDLQKLLPELKVPNFPITTTIQSINVAVTEQISKELNKEELSSKIQIDIAEAIRKDPNVKLAIQEEIENY